MLGAAITKQQEQLRQLQNAFAPGSPQVTGAQTELNRLISQHELALREMQREASKANQTLAKQVGVLGDVATETDVTTAAVGKLADAQNTLIETFRNDSEADLRLRQLRSQKRVTEDLAKTERDRAGAAQKSADALRRTQEQQSLETQRQLDAPFENFLHSVQSSTAAAFETIYSGGVDSFSDLFATAKQLAIRFAAELSALAIFNPSMVQQLLGSTPAAAGTAGATPAAAGAFGLPSGTFGAAGLGGAAGIIGGSLIGGQTGGIGGGLGGALGAGVGFAASGGNPFIAAAGGALGGIAGSLLGSLFGGGDKRARFSGSGGLGQVSGGDIGSFIASIDQGLQDILNARQESLVNAVLQQSQVRVNAKDFDPNVQAFAASQRIGPAAQALGFNANAITGGGQAPAQQQLQNLETALQVQRAIEDLTGSVSTFDRQTEDLADQFSDLEASAKRFAISTDGLAAARNKAAAELQKTQDAALKALLDPFEQLDQPLETLQKQLDFLGKNPAQQFAFAQQDFERIAADALAGSTTAIGQLVDAGQLFAQQADQFGASPAVATAIDEVQGVLQAVRDEIAVSQAEASEGIEDAVDRARRDIVDTLAEVVDQIKKMAGELRRMN